MEEPASKCRILQSKNSVCATVQRFDSYVGCLQELATEIVFVKVYDFIWKYNCFEQWVSWNGGLPF